MPLFWQNFHHWQNVLDDLSMTLTQRHGCGIISKNLLVCRMTTSSAACDKMLSKRQHFRFSLKINPFYDTTMNIVQLIEVKWCIYASVNYAIIVSDNGLLPGRRQAIVWSNTGIVNCTFRNKLQWNFNRKFVYFHERNCIWKGRLPNGYHFISASMC